MIELRGLTVGYAGRPVLREVSMAFSPGQVTALLGPNGCGKSTLMKTALGLMPRLGGEILYDGVALERLTPRQVARKAAYLAQSREIPSITARRMVLHGRFPYLDFPRRYRREDYRAVDRALERTGASELADRFLPQLSGGQRQKVYLAMVLAQDTPVILMDEPTTYLDVRCQLETMELARWLAEEGRAVVIATHELCLAMQYAHRGVLLDGGRVCRAGTPEELLSTGELERVMGVSLGRTMTAGGWRYFYLN